MHPTGSMQSTIASDNNHDSHDDLSATGMKANPATVQAGVTPHSAATSYSVTETSLLRHEVAIYITQMSAELSAMARSSEFTLLSYFLDMAAAEARESADKLCSADSDDEPDQPRIPRPDQTLT